MEIAAAFLSAIIMFPISMLVAKFIRDAYCDAKKLERSKKLFWIIALCSFAFGVIGNLFFLL